MIIKEIRVWDEIYVPDKILFRREQLGRLDECLQGAFKYGRASNALCIGDFGVGKTASIRYILKQAGKEAREKDIHFKYYYFNCADFAQTGKSITLNRIVSNILQEEGIKGIYPTLPWEVKFEKFKNLIRNFNSTVLVLDEIDFYLHQKGNDFQTLAYIFSRSLSGTSLILISNKFWVPHFLQNLDTRVVDTFTKRMRTIAFNEYSVDELYGILGARAVMGLYEGSYDEEVLDYIARISFERGLRARGLIDITREAAMLAERERSNKIKFSHVNKVSSLTYEQELKKIIKTFDPPAINVLLLLINRGGHGIEREIFEEFEQKSEKDGFISSISRATFYNALSRLKGMEIIRSELKGKGRYRRAILHVNEDYFDIVKKGVKEAIEEIQSSKRG